jgi:predicted Rossmann-fold nucleotide-binding protein
LILRANGLADARAGERVSSDIKGAKIKRSEEMSNLFDLTGKVAVVTGCDTGLGQGMARALAEAGCSISGVNVVAPTETAASLRSGGHRFLDICRLPDFRIWMIKNWNYSLFHHR